MSDPDLDKTNPDPSYLHLDLDLPTGTDPARLWLTDEEAEFQKALEHADPDDPVMTDTLSKEGLPLRDPMYQYNTPGDALEGAREEPIWTDNPRYPDEFIRQVAGNPSNQVEFSYEEERVEDLFGGTQDFDLEQEHELDETRPLE